MKIWFAKRFHEPLRTDKKRKKEKEKKEAKKNRGEAEGGGGKNENNEVPDRDDLNYIN